MGSDVVVPEIPDQVPDVVGTPEGDNEFPPDEPLTQLPDGAQEPFPG